MSPRQICSHERLTVEVSPHAEQAGFKRQVWKRRIAATTASGRFPSRAASTGEIGLSSAQSEQVLAASFPAPLVLPGDDLALDPSDTPQSLRSWLRGEHRNKLIYKKKTLYVADVPSVSKSTRLVHSWTHPVVMDQTKEAKASLSIEPLNPDDIREYLGAFYHGLPVKKLPQALEFTAWRDDGEKLKDTCGPAFIGLQYGAFCTRIRTRDCPDGRFARQLNLNDIIDAAMDMLPNDAYALLLLVDHDLYEDEEDDFCCGRAYGGSRVAVVSSARYHPALLLYGGDDIDLNHTWPASHCESYVASLCKTPAESMKTSLPFQALNPAVDASTPLNAALAAFTTTKAILSANSPPPPPKHLRGLWLCLVARTASHELGHCLGLAHCVYYACVMQSTAGMAEDCRQPPYLCPVCMSKLVRAVQEIGTSSNFNEKQYLIKAYQVMGGFCEKWGHVGMLAGYKAWLDTMSRRLQESLVED